MSSPNLPPAEGAHDRLADKERMEHIRGMARMILVGPRSRYKDDRILGPVIEASWVARGLEYFCELRTRANDPFSFFQLDFSQIRTTEKNTYAFRAERDDITASLRSVTDDLKRPHIDRLEEVITSASLPGAYSGEGFVATEEVEPSIVVEEGEEIEIENPWLDSEH